MRTATVLSARDQFSNEFARCCRDYKFLHIAVAWCGDPKHTLPYKHLSDFKGDISATVGYSFNQTHPDAIQWLLDKASAVRIFRREKSLFHPKLYLFTDGDRYALFAGSSNLTYCGFYENLEANVLLEGTLSTGADVRKLQVLLEKWRSPEFSFTPNKKWLEGYRKDHKRDRDAQRKAGIKTEALEEESFGPNWLEKADWKIYHQQVIEGMKKSRRDIEGFHHVLDAAAQHLSVPWKTSYFKDPEKRRIIGGVKPYGPMGHVFASGGFGHLVAHQSLSWGALVNAVNQIAKLEPPVKWSKLQSHLRQLIGLGNSMKVWGRVLALIRPDLYCSVSSISVRRELAKTLKVSMQRFEQVDGYIRLLKLLHSSPWFNSRRPADANEAATWDRRVAFMDGIFWHPKRSDGRS
jgi:phospholipase D-like protein